MTDAWITVSGLGVWTPGFATVRAWRDGHRSAAAEEPPARLPARLRRRTSLLVRMVAEVAAQACEQAGVSPAGLPIVVGSAFGELGTTMEMLNELETDRALSPFRFHNSVHNTAAAYLSIAHENRAACMSLAAGNDTAAMVLYESAALLADRGGDVLAIVADEALPEALVGPGGVPLSAAAVLRAGRAPERDGRVALAWAGDLRQGPDAAPILDRPSAGQNPSEPFLRFVAAVEDAAERGIATRVELTGGGAARWSIAVTPPRAS